jgi:hypothetical protein
MLELEIDFVRLIAEALLAYFKQHSIMYYIRSGYI